MSSYSIWGKIWPINTVMTSKLTEFILTSGRVLSPSAGFLRRVLWLCIPGKNNCFLGWSLIQQTNSIRNSIVRARKLHLFIFGCITLHSIGRSSLFTRLQSHGRRERDLTISRLIKVTLSKAQRRCRTAARHSRKGNWLGGLSLLWIVDISNWTHRLTVLSNEMGARARFRTYPP
jgi:hypothetical protein